MPILNYVQTAVATVSDRVLCNPNATRMSIIIQAVSQDTTLHSSPSGNVFVLKEGNTVEFERNDAFDISGKITCDLVNGSSLKASSDENINNSQVVKVASAGTAAANGYYENKGFHPKYGTPYYEKSDDTDYIIYRASTSWVLKKVSTDASLYSLANATNSDITVEYPSGIAPVWSLGSGSNPVPTVTTT